jgi:hypothetical protein
LVGIVSTLQANIFSETGTKPVNRKLNFGLFYALEKVHQ